MDLMEKRSWISLVESIKPLTTVLRYNAPSHGKKCNRTSVHRGHRIDRQGTPEITKSVHPILATMLSCIRAIDARF